MTGFIVISERCDQCLFDGENRIVTRQRAAQVLRTCAKEDRHFICHKATLVGKEACCRGFYDANPEATNRMRIASRLNMVEFVDEADL